MLARVMLVSMNIRATFAAVLLLSTAAVAQDHGYWKAVSTTARGVTGDISLSEEKLMMNFTPIVIAEIRPLTPDESKAVFDLQDGQSGEGKLYRLNVPAKKAFLHHNTLCGADDTQWLLTYASGKTLQTAFFSGAQMPVLTREAIGSSTSLCGTYSYSK